MSIALPNTTKRGLTGLFGSKKPAPTSGVAAAKKKLKSREIAALFSQSANENQRRAAKLNDTEKQERAELSSLRGALYSKD